MRAIHCALLVLAGLASIAVSEDFLPSDEPSSSMAENEPPTGPVMAGMWKS